MRKFIISYNTHNILVYSNFSSNTVTFVTYLGAGWLESQWQHWVTWLSHFCSFPQSLQANAIMFPSKFFLIHYLLIIWTFLCMYSETLTVSLVNILIHHHHLNYITKWTTNTCMHWDHLGTCSRSKPVSFTTQHICNHSSKHREIPAGLCKASRPYDCTITAVTECDACQVIWSLT
jgi:hypothetical protein